MITQEDFLSFFEDSREFGSEEKRLLFRSVRRTIFLHLLGQKKFHKDIANEINLQRKFFSKLNRNSPQKLRRLAADLLIEEATVRGRMRGKKINPYALEKIIIDAKVSVLEKFMNLSSGDRDNFQKVGERFERSRDRIISRQTKKGWGIGLGVSAALIAGAVAFYKSSSDKREEK